MINGYLTYEELNTLPIGTMVTDRDYQGVIVAHEGCRYDCRQILWQNGHTSFCLSDFMGMTTPAGTPYPSNMQLLEIPNECPYCKGLGFTVISHPRYGDEVTPCPDCELTA